MDIRIEVACALPEFQEILEVLVPEGTTARSALQHSGLMKAFPQIDPEHCSLGVFGQVVEDSYRLKAQDRLEVYRPLQQDPREARRRLAALGQTIGSSKRHEG